MHLKTIQKKTQTKFYKAFYNYLEQFSETIILAGDFNYASENIDRFQHYATQRNPN